MYVLPLLTISCINKLRAWPTIDKINLSILQDSVIVDTTTIDSTFFPYQRYISFAPSALLNPTPGVQFGYEQIFKDKYALIGEVGGLLSIQEDRKGVRFKAEARIYRGSRCKRYFALEAVHKYTQTNISDWVDAGTHQQLITYKGLRRLTYACTKFGVNTAFEENSRIFFDFGISLGGGIYSVSTRDIPEQFVSREFFSGFFFDNSFRERVDLVPMVAFSLKLKYAFNF